VGPNYELPKRKERGQTGGDREKVTGVFGDAEI